MTANLNKIAVSAAKYYFWAVKNGNYPYGATGTISAGSDQGMQRHKGLATINVSLPEAPREAILGDGGKLGEFLGAILEPSAATVSFSILDQDYETAARRTTIYADGEFDAVIVSTNCVNPNDLCAVLNIKAKSFDTGASSQDKWLVIELWDFQDSTNFLNELSGSSYASVLNTHTLALDETTTEITGLAVNSTNYGVTQGTLKYYWSEYPVTFHTHIGNAADTTLTLDYTPAANSGAKVQLWQAGVAKAYTTDYTVSGTAFTFVAAPGASVVSIIRYQFVDSC